MLATYLVSNLNDAPVAALQVDAPGTLRQAIYDANHSTHDDDPDIIQFSAALTGDINLSVTDDLTFGPSALVITSSMRIEGNGHRLTIQRDSSVPNLRLFVVAPGADLTIDSVMLTGGIAEGAVGAAGENGGDGRGGAIYNQGTTSVVASTLYGNSAIAGAPGEGGTFGLALGGAIYSDSGTVSIHNSTISGNSASIAGSPVTNTRGGGVYATNATLNIYNSTITDNSAGLTRDVYIIGEGAGTAILNIFSSIVARADANTNLLDLNATYDQFEQQLEVHGANNVLRRHNLPLSAAITASDPLVSPLADNGGPTLTHALLADSSAFGLGSNLLGLATDQRGGSSGRSFLGRIDIGSFETQSVVGPPPPGDYNLNQTVDAADYVVWRKNVGRTVTQFAPADGDGNTQIDSLDYLVWRSQFGATTMPPAPTIDGFKNKSTVECAPQSAAPMHDVLLRSPPRGAWFDSIPDSLSIERQTSISTENASSNITLEARQTALLQIIGDQGIPEKDSSSPSLKVSSESNHYAQISDSVFGSLNTSIRATWT
jgi:hypothetical protein